MKLILLLAVLATPCFSNQEPTRSVAQMILNSKLVLEGIITKTEEISVQVVKGSGKPLEIHKHRGTMRIDKSYKGLLTPEETKSGSISIFYKQVYDARYKGDKVPPMKEGERYFLFIESFDLSDGHRVALLHTRNNVRDAAEVVADPAAKKSLEASIPKNK